jgi:hypothetical protein
MKQEYKDFELEDIEFGTAKVKVLKTMDGEYGMHGQTGWDDTPYWIYWDAWFVTVQAYGNIDWGPFKKRKDAKKEHSETTKINLLEIKIFDSKNDAEDHALEEAIKFEQKGFDVKIESGNDPEEHRTFKTQYRIDSSIEYSLIRKFNPKLVSLYLKENERRCTK